VIIPLRKQRHLGIEREQIPVEQVVFIVAAKLRERLGDLGFLLGHDVLPHASVRQLPLRLDRTVGIDVIAGMNEEIGPAFQHGGICAHPAARLVDPPAAGGVPRPHERYIAPLARGGPETPDLRRA